MKSCCANTILLVFFILFFVYNIEADERYAKPAEEGEILGCYISNGDNDILYQSPPIDSPAAIDGVLDILQKVYGVKRLYWRATQIEQIVNHSIVKPGNFYYSDWLNWMDHLYNTIGTGKYAVDAAHKRGMSVWGIAALFDHGAQPLVDVSKAMGPWPIEGKIRAKNSEWIPIDKFGIRKQSGLICLAYPDARTALVNEFVEIAKSADYDGLMFHTYIEEFYTRFETEFGYNDPIVADYKKRYGVDIRSEPFDEKKWAELRGEYVTEFLMELKSALSEIDVKLGIFLSSKNPDYPQYWLAGGTSLRPTGLIHIDWKKYIQQGIVDEIFVYCCGEVYSVLEDIINYSENTNLDVSVLHSTVFPDDYKHFIKAGVIRTMSGSYKDFEHGYFEELPASAIDSEDFIARLTVIQQMADGKNEIDFEKIVNAIDDPHVLVRRRAVSVLAGMENIPEKAVKAIIKALDDEENTVRCYAVNALVKHGDESSIEKICDSVSRNYTAMVKMAAIWSFPNLIQKYPEQILNGLDHPDYRIKYIILRAIASSAPLNIVMNKIISLTNDNNPQVRYAAAMALGKFSREKTQKALLRLIDDPHPTVHNRAAFELSRQMQSNTKWIGPVAYETFNKLKDKYLSFNSGYISNDSDWAWRCIGEALQRTGPRGKEFIKTQLYSNDLVISDNCWRLLYAPQTGNSFVETTFEKAQIQYQLHHRLRVPKTTEYEPEMMPYIIQDFDGYDFVLSGQGTAGDIHHHNGLWRHINEKQGCTMCTVVCSDNENKAIKLTVIKNDKNCFIDALRTDYRISSGKMNIEFKIFRSSNKSGFLFWFTDSGTWSSNLKVLIDSEGIIKYYDINNRLLSTDYQAPYEEWFMLKLTADLSTNTCDIIYKTHDNNEHVVADIELLAGQQYNNVIFMPSGTKGYVYIDDVSVKVTNPAKN